MGVIFLGKDPEITHRRALGPSSSVEKMLKLTGTANTKSVQYPEHRH